MSLSVFLGIKHALSLWSSIVLMRAICRIRGGLRACGPDLCLNWKVMSANLVLVFLSQLTQITQFGVMMTFFWAQSIDQIWVQHMDFLDDITHLVISMIFAFLFWNFVSVEQKLLHQFKGVRGFHTLLAENPMLRYKTSNGPITTPLGLLSLSTMSSSMYYQHNSPSYHLYNNACNTLSSSASRSGG